MSRKSRLLVMIRFARLKEDRALQDLGRTCVVIDSTESEIERLACNLDSTRAGRMLELGAQRDAGTLALLAHSGRGIDWRSQEHKARLIHARAAEEEAQRGWSDEREMCG